MAHKIGKYKQLGLGSLQLSIAEDSYLINWGGKYSSGNDKEKINLTDWIDPKVIINHDDLIKLLDASAI